MLPGKIDLFNVGKQGIDSKFFLKFWWIKFILSFKVDEEKKKKKFAPSVCVSTDISKDIDREYIIGEERKKMNVWK